MNRAALYICYYDVTEPLVQTQVVAYLRELARHGVSIHLLTFDRRRMSEAEQDVVRQRLTQAGIEWHSVRYHQRPSLPATLYDIAIGSAAAFRLCRRYDIRLIHARSHVAAAMALPSKRLLGCRILFDVRGLLAEEYVDAGHWKREGLKFRLTKRVERTLFREADALVMLTHRIKSELVDKEPALRGRADDIEVIPCCVDTDCFERLQDTRKTYRRERGWQDRLVIVYVGKLGTWYLPGEMAQFFAVARRNNPRLFFQILTQSDPTPMQSALQSSEVSTNDFDIAFVPPRDLPQLLTAADAGISFIRASYSKRASSPTKIGEYLAAGLPVVTNAGIGDCDSMMERFQVGVIVQEFNQAEYVLAARELISLLAREDTARRCRECAVVELSLSAVGTPRYASVYDRLLGRNTRQSFGGDARHQVTVGTGCG